MIGIRQFLSPPNPMLDPFFSSMPITLYLLLPTAITSPIALLDPKTIFLTSSPIIITCLPQFISSMEKFLPSAILYPEVSRQFSSVPVIFMFGSVFFLSYLIVATLLANVETEVFAVLLNRSLNLIASAYLIEGLNMLKMDLI